MKTEPSHTQKKSALRREIRRERRAIPADQRREKDQSINESLIAYVREFDVKCMAAFFAFDGEPSLEPALRLALEESCIVALPVIAGKGSTATMEFRQWRRDCELRRNDFGIFEPVGTPLLQALDFDLVLVPLVGWDDRGYRLGMGAGYYDRYLQPWAESSRPVRAGVAYDLQRYRQLPRDPWDVPLHRIFTESGLKTFNTEEQQ